MAKHTFTTSTPPERAASGSELDMFYEALGPAGTVMASALLVGLFLPLTALAAILAVGAAAAHAAGRAL